MPNLPSNKLERLSIECLHGNFQYPCGGNQKWYCKLEDGRWRKHKCKLQIHIPRQIYKKCACLTVDGVIYKKIPVSAKKQNTPSNKSPFLIKLQVNNTIKRGQRINRLKREAIYDDLFINLSKEVMFELTGRQKRDTLTHVESVMTNIRNKLTGLEVKITLLYLGNRYLKTLCNS